MSDFKTAGARKAGLSEMIRKMDAAQGDVRDNGFTLGWDIIASYSEKEINKLLADRYKKSDRMVKKIDGIKTSVKDPKTRKWTDRFYSLDFDAPLVQFHGATANEPSCELIMPIISGYFQEQPQGKPLEEEQYPITDEGQRLILSISGIPLGTVKGKYTELKDKSKANDVQDIKTGSHIVKFEKQAPEGAKGETAYVVLNLPLGNQISIKIRPADPNADVNEDARILEGPLINFFKDPTKIDVIEYSLARINNYPDPQGITNNLCPTSFQMATFSSHDFPDSILSLLIHVQGGQDAGERNDVQQKWAGQWVDKRINAAPIPKGYTASLILSADLVYSQLIKSGMEKGGMYRCDQKRRRDRQQGITWNVQRIQDWVTYWHKIDYRQNNDDSVLEVDGFTKNFKDDPLIIDLKQSSFESGPNAHVKWTFKTRSKWNDVSKDTKWWNFGQRALYTTGEVETTYVLDRDFPCTISMTDEAFKLDIDTETDTSKSSAWTVTTRRVPDSGDWVDFMIIDPPKSAIERMHRQIASVSPRVDIAAMGLGVLRTTNLLLPGEKVINFDHEMGVRIPRDLVLVGDVVKK